MMTSSLAVIAALLAADPSPSLPPGHPALDAPIQSAPPVPRGALPEGHPPATGRAPPTAEELLRQLDATEGLLERGKTFEIAAALGKLYQMNGRAKDALPYFLQAEQKAEGLRALYLAERQKLGAKPVPSADEAGCDFIRDSTVEAMGAI